MVVLDTLSKQAMRVVVLDTLSIKASGAKPLVEELTEKRPGALGIKDSRTICKVLGSIPSAGKRTGLGGILMEWSDSSFPRL